MSKASIFSQNDGLRSQMMVKSPKILTKLENISTNKLPIFKNSPLILKKYDGNKIAVNSTELKNLNDTIEIRTYISDALFPIINIPNSIKNNESQNVAHSISKIENQNDQSKSKEIDQIDSKIQCLRQSKILNESIKKMVKLRNNLPKNDYTLTDYSNNKKQNENYLKGFGDQKTDKIKPNLLKDNREAESSLYALEERKLNYTSKINSQNKNGLKSDSYKNSKDQETRLPTITKVESSYEKRLDLGGKSPNGLIPLDKTCFIPKDSIKILRANLEEESYRMKSRQSLKTQIKVDKEAENNGDSGYNEAKNSSIIMLNQVNFYKSEYPNQNMSFEFNLGLESPKMQSGVGIYSAYYPNSARIPGENFKKESNNAFFLNNCEYQNEKIELITPIIYKKQKNALCILTDDVKMPDHLNDDHDLKCLERKSLIDNMNDKKIILTALHNHKSKFYFEAQEPKDKDFENDSDNKDLNTITELE